MCTVAFEWYPKRPGDNGAFMAAANRDENPNRPSTGFEYRNNHQAFYPLDVGGGSWIGVNESGVFCAITNRDDTKFVPGRKSRGKLVTKALDESSEVYDISSWADSLNPLEYNGFRLIACDPYSCKIWSGDATSQEVQISELEPGLHVVSGFGIDTWEVERCQKIKSDFSMSYASLIKLLSFHGNGTVNSAVCVHDPNEYHKTVSSCIIKREADDSFLVYETTVPPCKSDWKMHGFSALNKKDRILLDYILKCIETFPEKKIELLDIANSMCFFDHGLSYGLRAALGHLKRAEDLRAAIVDIKLMMNRVNKNAKSQTDKL